MNLKSGFRSNDLSSRYHACISLLRQKQPQLIARWSATKVADITLCSIVVYELRHGAESSADPPREHGKLDIFLAPFSSVAFDDACAAKCAQIRRALERNGEVIGPHDLQIDAIALRHNLTLVTHNTREFGRIPCSDWTIGRLDNNHTRSIDERLGSEALHQSRPRSRFAFLEGP